MSLWAKTKLPIPSHIEPLWKWRGTGWCETRTKLNMWFPQCPMAMSQNTTSSHPNWDNGQRSQWRWNGLSLTHFGKQWELLVQLAGLCAAHIQKIWHKLVPWFDVNCTNGTKVLVWKATAEAKKHDWLLCHSKKCLPFAIICQLKKARGAMDRAIAHKVQEGQKHKKDAHKTFWNNKMLSKTMVLNGASHWVDAQVSSNQLMLEWTNHGRRIFDIIWKIGCLIRFTVVKNLMRSIVASLVIKSWGKPMKIMCQIHGAISLFAFL